MAKIQYTKLDPIDHILSRPDMYVGSRKQEATTDYVFVEGKLKMCEFVSSPAFIRTFQEILSNAVDNNERQATPKMSYIKIDISQDMISIENDGAGIPIAVNTESGLYNHTLIFGHLLSGSNYDDSEERFTSGRNGLGAKLTNVLSKKFVVEAYDSESKLLLSQVWENNMRKVGAVVVKPKAKGRGYTKITWWPDFPWFGMPQLDARLCQFLCALALNASVITGLKVFVHHPFGSSDLQLPNKLSDYFGLMTEPSVQSQDAMLKLGDAATDATAATSRVFVMPSTSGFEAISFVNGIRTKNGGKHVTAWVEAVCRPLVSRLVGKKEKDNQLTIRDVKPFFRFLVVTRVANPVFESQEKNELKTNVQASPITPAQVTKILGWSVGNSLKELMLKKEKKGAVREIATNKAKHAKVDGYDRANYAGSKHSKDCTLIVCEGLSAKTFCVEGVSVGIPGLPGRGRDYFGIFPLRGKLLNTRNASPSAISKNAVVTNLMNIIGLDYGRPTALDRLNYGRVVILTDADTDGIHIEGLLLNFFHSLFPVLLKNNFVFSMKTPLVRVGQRYFFDDKAWKTFAATHLPKNTQVTYHKGLGTIKQNEVKQVFGKKMLEFVEDTNSDRSFVIAFGKEESAERKTWLSNYSPLIGHAGYTYPTLDDEKEQTVKFTISRHLNTELIKFFHDDCKRSLPSAIDGLKESQRKIVYSAKTKCMKTEMKVAQFAAAVAELTSYHHGEQNLANTIVKLAQSYVGSNNLQLLTEGGMFGSRLEGGEDAASPRYIFTKPAPYFDSIFPSEDDLLLEKREDDGDLVEPYYYAPTIPMLLVNGAVGIGTGWSCACPSFDPDVVLEAARLWMQSHQTDPNLVQTEKSEGRKLFESFVETMTPWYRNFKGKIQKTGPGKFETTGIYQKNSSGSIHITELPIGVWTAHFVQWLEEKEIQYINRSTPCEVDITLNLDNLNLSELDKKMKTKISLDNITVFDQHDAIKKASLISIFDIWGNAKLSVLQKRKQTKLKQLASEKRVAAVKHAFIVAVKAKEIVLTADLPEIVAKINNITTNKNDHRLLLDMNIRSLTSEKSTELEERIAELDVEIFALENKTEKQLWKEDAQRFKNTTKDI